MKKNLTLGHIYLIVSTLSRNHQQLQSEKSGSIKDLKMLPDLQIIRLILKPCSSVEECRLWESRKKIKLLSLSQGQLTMIH